MSLGETISDTRKKLGYTQKHLAECVQKEDGSPITAQYLNDIEHDRRTPSSPVLIEQLAKALQLQPEVLYFEAGTLPSDLQNLSVPTERVVAAFQAFRKELEGEKKQ
jgi:transcriptional regulator with XRE-family HTH domain